MKTKTKTVGKTTDQSVVATETQTVKVELNEDQLFWLRSGLSEAWNSHTKTMMKRINEGQLSEAKISEELANEYYAKMQEITKLMEALK